MPYEILWNEPVGGYARGDATGPGERIEVVVTEFTSSADGELFVTRLEGIPLRLLTHLPTRIDPSMINHLIAILRKDGTATVYVNECEVFAQVRLGRRIEQFEDILEHDIVDISSLSFRPVEFPPDAGIICVFSSGWRKGFFLDVRPLHGDHPKRNFDVPKALGAGMSKMIHHDLFTLTDDDWQFITGEQWFPFATLSRPLRRSLIGMAKRRTDVNCLLPRIALSVKSMVPHLRLRWSESAILQPHLSLLLHALDEFEEGDSVSCTAILYPRIEGILRSAHEALGRTDRTTQRVLSGVAVEGKRAELHEYSWMIPDRFEQYIRDVCEAFEEQHWSRCCHGRRVQRKERLHQHSLHRSDLLPATVRDGGSAPLRGFDR